MAEKWGQKNGNHIRIFLPHFSCQTREEGAEMPAEYAERGAQQLPGRRFLRHSAYSAGNSASGLNSPSVNSMSLGWCRSHLCPSEVNFLCFRLLGFVFFRVLLRPFSFPLPVVAAPPPLDVAPPRSSRLDGLFFRFFVFELYHFAGDRVHVDLGDVF